MDRKKKQKPSYLREMLQHRLSVAGFFGAVAGGAALSVVAAPLAAIPIVGFLAAESLAVLFVPGSKWWQDRVDIKHRRIQRDATRASTLSEIEKRVPSAASTKDGDTYRRMLDRVATLARTAADKSSQVTPRDVERFDDATINYLSAWLLSLVLRERQEAFRGEDLDRRVAELERKLTDKSVQGADRLRFEKAKDDLQKVLERRTSVDSQLATARASMLTIADALEEIFGNVMKNPSGEDVRGYLDMAIEQVRIEDGAEVEADSQLEDAFAELEREAAHKAKR